MREHKYRAWDKAENKMLPWEEINECLLLDLEYENNRIFLEYTGLKDKNGKEIYEGDVMLQDGYHPCNKFQVEYGWHYDHSTYKEMIGYALFEDNKYEILGNIYENPELLKVSK